MRIGRARKRITMGEMIVERLGAVGSHATRQI
jgi:hypothetical protein